MAIFESEIISGSAKKFGTPFFIYDADIIRESYQLLRSSLPDSVDIFYSIKANPNLALISEMYKMGASVELCSFFEISAALLAGVKPADIIFVGPAKSPREIEKCIDLGIHAIVCESISEFELISNISKNKNTRARVALRINPSHSAKTAMLKMGGASVQFGMDEEIIFEKIDFFALNPNIHITGIHAYHGTRILDAETLAENTEYIFLLAEKFQKASGICLEFVDIGGGLGVPYYEGEQSIDFSAFKHKMKLEIDNYLAKFSSSRIIIESGRFLIARSGYLVARVIDIKVSKGLKIMITDAGMNCFMAASSASSFLNRNFKISLVKQNYFDLGFDEEYTLVGPLCTPGDVMARKIQLPKAEIGDLIVFHNAGAYGPTASPVMFLSHGFPAEILYKNTKTHLIRSRFSEENFFQNQPLVQEDPQ